MWWTLSTREHSPDEPYPARDEHYPTRDEPYPTRTEHSPSQYSTGCFKKEILIIIPEAVRGGVFNIKNKENKENNNIKYH